MAHPTQQQVDRVVAMTDPVRRNVAITTCYRDLSVAVADILGRRDVNWLAFGAWASGTAGRVIRGEGLPLDWGTSEAVAEGNRTIIADVAPRFVRWLDEVERAGEPSRAALDVALADAMFDQTPDLADALEAYQQAFEVLQLSGDLAADAEADRAVAELVLLGNVKVAAHEQRIADDLIDDAMPLGGLFGRITTRFVEVITPDGALDVCRDVPAPSYLAGQRFPGVLSQLSHADLCTLAEQYDHALDIAVIGSRATSWECYDERMGFIFCFFRAFARDARYFDLPAEFLR